MAQSGSSPGEDPTCVTGNLSRSSRGPGIARFLLCYSTCQPRLRESRERRRSSPSEGIHGLGWRVNGFSAHFRVRTNVYAGDVASNVPLVGMSSRKSVSCAKSLQKRRGSRRLCAQLYSQRPVARPTRRKSSASPGCHDIFQT